MTRVSIITPSYNQAAYLEETIHSVLDQGYPDLEYILVDGGSNDGSQEIIKRYAAQLAWWVSEHDSGQAEAINKGLAHAHGEFVAWLNSDDTYLPNAIAEAVKALEANPQVVMVYGNLLAVDEHGRTINLLHYHQLSLEDLLAFQIIGQPAVFMRRAVCERIGGLDPTFHYLLDHHLWIRLAAQGPICHVDSTWAAARYHPAAKNRAQAPRFGREAFRILDWAQHQPEFAPLLSRMRRRARASAYRVEARYLLDGGQSWPALKAWTYALLIHPPTAFARLNLLSSALLNMMGLNALRSAYLRRRQRRLSHIE
jgi:glycosyltransferase involved in cell wall biosynthesis